MIPTHFEAGENVLPEVILDRAGKRQDFVRGRRCDDDVTSVWVGCAKGKQLLVATVAQILSTSIEAQLFGGLEGQITAQRPGFAVGIMNIEVVERSTSFQAGDWSV